VRQSSRFFFFFSFFFFFLFSQVREAEKSGAVLFHEAMDMIGGDLEKHPTSLEKIFRLFERAAAKGHEESIWISSVAQNVEKDKTALKNAFSKTEKPLGWYLAGELSDPCSQDQFNCMQKSAEGGYSWGRVKYSWFYKAGAFVEQDEEAYLELIQQAAEQSNPQALNELGYWFGWKRDIDKAISYFRAAAELGWKNSMDPLAGMLRNGEGCRRDSRQAAIWSATGGKSSVFWALLDQIRPDYGGPTDLDCNFDQVCYALGWGIYWYVHGSESWNQQTREHYTFDICCLIHYCSCVELQQESIFTFLMCWKRTIGVMDVGQMIAEMVWEGRADNLLKTFGKK
jgi:TPR repeat protein